MYPVPKLESSRVCTRASLEDTLAGLLYNASIRSALCHKRGRKRSGDERAKKGRIQRGETKKIGRSDEYTITFDVMWQAIYNEAHVE
jgi:hypothetical protein